MNDFRIIDLRAAMASRQRRHEIAEAGQREIADMFADMPGPDDPMWTDSINYACGPEHGLDFQIRIRD